jgi:BON domain
MNSPTSSLPWRAAAALVLAGLASAPRADDERSNTFDDPFLQATRALPRCPVPEGPLYTAAQAKAQIHGRAERGTTCHYWGRCRLPNAYLYDKEIIPRVATFIQRDDRFQNTSIWILGQRRWVYLKGCVANQAQSDQLEAEVRLIDDVEAVINELMVGVSGTPRYDLDRAAK